MQKVRILILLTMTLVMTGCWDKLELEDQAYVIALGFDKGLEEDSLIITLQIANPQVGSSDTAKAEKEPAQQLVTIMVPDKVAIRDLANIAVSRRITYDQMRTFIISEELLKEDLFFPLLDSITRDPQFQRDAHMIVSKEKAMEFMTNNKPILETRPHKNYTFMVERWKDTGLVPETKVSSLLQRIEEDAGLFLATYATVVKEEKGEEEKTTPTQGDSSESLGENTDTNDGEKILKPKEGQKYGLEDDYIAGQVIKSGGNPVQMIGSAVLNEGKMVGVMTGEETRLTLLLRPHAVANNWIAVYKDPLNPKSHITTMLDRTAPKITVDVSQGDPIIECTVKVSLELLVIRSFENYISDLDKQVKLEASIEKQLEEKSMDLVKRTKKELKGDPFQWSLIARKQFLTVNEWKKYDWKKRYPNAKVKVNYDVHITTFGKQMDPIDKQKIKD